MTACILALGMLSQPVSAADTAGSFAIKGGGLQPCSAFLTAWDQKTTDLGLYAGWIDGYLTGLNQFTPDTYDIASWQTTDTLLGMTRSVCTQAPTETRFMDAFFQIVQVMTPSRLQTEAPLVALVHDGQSLLTYGPVIERLKTRLNDMAYGEGLDENQTFDTATTTAIAAFQTAESLPPSGMPDQQTLFRLFTRNLQ